VGRSECWESLLVQIKGAESTGIFVFASRELDGVGAVELARYLRDVCRARWVDLSRLGRWPDVSLAAAGALRHGLRALRSLALDGNDVGGCPRALEAWCEAVEEHPGLQRLSLRDTGFTNASASRLAAALREHSVLFSVDLSSNRIGDAGVEALTGAVTENRVLLELGVEDTDATAAARNTLEAVLERNRGRFEGQGGCAKLLQGLRRARAEAATALAHAAARTPAVGGALTRNGDFALAMDASARHLSTAVDVGEGRFVCLPLVPTEDEALRAEAENEPDGVFFDAGEGISQELRMRCEAGWRYTASQAEALGSWLKAVGDLKSERRHARDRTEEVHGRIAEAQRAFRERAMPVESKIIELKEQLAAEVEATKLLLQEKIRHSITLKGAEAELETAQHERRLLAETVQKREHGLKLRHREVAEEVQVLEAQVIRAEEEVAGLERENEVARRRLHAARFETETERFVPRALAIVAGDG